MIRLLPVGQPKAHSFQLAKKMTKYVESVLLSYDRYYARRNFAACFRELGPFHFILRHEGSDWWDAKEEKAKLHLPEHAYTKWSHLETRDTDIRFV